MPPDLRFGPLQRQHRDIRAEQPWRDKPKESGPGVVRSTAELALAGATFGLVQEANRGHWFFATNDPRLANMLRATLIVLGALALISLAASRLRRRAGRSEDREAPDPELPASGAGVQRFAAAFRALLGVGFTTIATLVALRSGNAIDTFMAAMFISADAEMAAGPSVAIARKALRDRKGRRRNTR